jgi:hypothetical protein
MPASGRLKYASLKQPAVKAIPKIAAAVLRIWPG